MKAKKLKSFTVLEALISLMLMGIIIAISYALFNVLGKQMSLFEKENIDELQYNLFNTAIISDIEKANDFKLINEDLILKNYNDTIIKYSIKANYILRMHSVKTDTFKVNVLTHNFIERNATTLDKILEIKMELLNDTITANYFLNKNNAEHINSMYFNED